MKLKNLIFFILSGLIIFSACKRLSGKQQEELQDTINHIEDPEVEKININWDDIYVSDYPGGIDSTEQSQNIDFFYKNRDYKLAWIENGRLSQNAYDLLHELRNSIHEGLNPEDYKLYQTIEDSLVLNHSPDTSFTSPEQAVKTDVLLTDAFLSYASDLSTGRIDPDSIDIIWETYSKNINLPEYLEEALRKKKIHESLYKLGPHHESYYKLLDAYNNLSSKKDWPLPGYFPALRLNDSINNVLSVKKFLQATEDLFSPDNEYMDSWLFDLRLENAVKNFQQRHGLVSDGIVGKLTLEAMNMPLETRLNQILVNIDRIRFLPSDMGDRFIIVNIPGYFLEYYEDYKLKLEMKVIVGKIENYTPVFKDTMSYIVFNPDWNVPYSIATTDLLPEIKSDSSYLERNDYILLKGTYTSTDVMNPEDIEWSEITEDNFPFSIVQSPGVNNALGRLKFMFPNNYSIYLHDTPATHIFEFEQRDFSHGCIRLERPADLAKTLLEGQLDPGEIDEFLLNEETADIILDKNVPVHFLYMTTWVDANGQLQFRSDIYEIDKLSGSHLTINE